MLEHIKFWIARELAEMTFVLVGLGILVGVCVIIGLYSIGKDKYRKWKNKKRR